MNKAAWQRACNQPFLTPLLAARRSEAGGGESCHRHVDPELDMKSSEVIFGTSGSAAGRYGVIRPRSAITIDLQHLDRGTPPPPCLLDLHICAPL